MADLSSTSVIVPAFNEGAAVAEVVGALRHCGHWKEVIVVDDGSSDETGQYAADPTRQREVFGQVPTAEDAISRFVGSLGHRVAA